MVLVTSQRKAEVLKLLRAANIEVKRVVEVVPPLDTGDPEEVLIVDSKGRALVVELDGNQIGRIVLGWDV